MRHADFLSPSLGDQLWDVFARHRRDAPVLWVDSIQMFCVFRYEDIRTCLTDQDFTVEYPFRVSREAFGRTLLDMDGPAHAALRRQLGGLLVGRHDNVSFVAPADACVSRLLDDLAVHQEFDFVPAVARQLPELVTGDFLGIDQDARPWVFDHLRYLLEHLDGSSRDFAVVGMLRREVEAHVNVLLREGGTPAGTLIAQLGTAVRAGELTLPDAVGLVLLVLAAGVETTTGLLANTMVALAAHPEWASTARADRSVLPRLVREVARWQPSQLDTVRFARRATRLGGMQIPEGKPLKLILASGNRDETVFPDPDRFWPDRPQRPLLSFGHGAHSCLGMHLALTVAVRFFQAFLSRFPRAEVIGPAPAVLGWTFRAPATLTVTLTGTARPPAMSVADGRPA